MHHETSRNSTKPNESGQGAIGLRQGSGVTGLTAAAQGPYLGERRDGEPVRRQPGGLAPGAVRGLLVVVVVTCKWCVDEDYATREVEMRFAWKGGREEHVRLEAATGRKAERRRRWSGAEEKGSGTDREVVAIAAAATDSMDGERSEVGCSRREIFFCPSSAGEFHFVFAGAGED